MGLGPYLAMPDKRNTSAFPKGCRLFRRPNDTRKSPAHSSQPRVGRGNDLPSLSSAVLLQSGGDELAEPVLDD